ncbi:MAG: thiamine phosphate synthase [Desulfovibrionaceae bacterium]
MTPRPAFDLSVYLVTDRPLCRGRGLVDVVLDAVRGGASVVQLREKRMSTREMVELGRALKSALAPLSVPLLINDRVDVALAVDAEGAHLGQTDMHWRDARALLGPDKLLGLTIDHMSEVLEARAADVDYLGVGPVFATTTKENPAPTWGPEKLAEAVRAAAQPVAAIGGIHAGNAEQAMAARPAGLAVVSAICSAPDPEASARSLRRIVGAAKG